jgi:nitrile hydratase
LIEQGLASTDAIDEIVSKYEQEIGPMNGARAVAKAWTDPEYKEWLLEDGSAALDDLGFTGMEGVDMYV